MDRDDLIILLQKLPKGTQVHLRGGWGDTDDAWGLRMRTFMENSSVHAYLEGVSGTHRNFPEGYRGVEELRFAGQKS